MKTRITESQLIGMIREAVENNYAKRAQIKESKKLVIKESELRNMILRAMNEAIGDEDDDYEELNSDDAALLNAANKGMTKAQKKSVEKDVENDSADNDIDIDSDEGSSIDPDTEEDSKPVYTGKTVKPSDWGADKTVTNAFGERDRASIEDTGTGLIKQQNGVPNLPLLVLTNFRDDDTYDLAVEIARNIMENGDFSEQLAGKPNFFSGSATNLRPTSPSGEDYPVKASDFEPSDEMKNNLYDGTESISEVIFAQGDGDSVYYVLDENYSIEDFIHQMNAIFNHKIKWDWKERKLKNGSINRIEPKWGGYTNRDAKAGNLPPYQYKGLPACDPRDYLPDYMIEKFEEIYEEIYPMDNNDEFNANQEYKQEKSDWSNNDRHEANRIGSQRFYNISQSGRKADY